MTLLGEVDAASAPALRASLGAAIEIGSGDIIIDCHSLSFMDSTGVTVLIWAHGRLAAGDTRSIRLRHTPEQIVRLLEICGIDHLFVSDNEPVGAVPVHWNDNREAAPTGQDPKASLALIKKIRAAPFGYSKGAVAWAEQQFDQMMDEQGHELN